MPKNQNKSSNKPLPPLKIVDEANVAVPIEVISTHIAKLAEAGEALRNSGLRERGILILLKDLTNLSLNDISVVLKALPRLREFLK